MSKDLEGTLAELGPEYRTVVARLKAGATAEDLRRETKDGGRCLASKVLGLKSYLVAASLLVAVGFSAVFFSRPSALKAQLSYAPREYRASVDEMIATQNADGSWQNDFLTRRNAEALRQSCSPGAKIAYKKAMRNLRAKGLL